MNDKKQNKLKSHFEGKTVLVTGHTGFKGSWLTAWLKLLGAKVVGIALEPSTVPSHFIAADLADGILDNRINIQDEFLLKDIIIASKPDYVFHLAAQALVRESYVNPIETWKTNVLGTLNVLESLKLLNKPCVAVLITSDKCYDNVEWVWGYKETDTLGGIDPYSASKGAAEIAIKSQIKSFFPSSGSVRIASARAGNVIGGGDWSDNRIVPDCIKAWSKNNVVDLRNPHSTRPWQHVLEPLSGYLNQAIAMAEDDRLHGESFNFGPLNQQNQSVLDLVREMAVHWKQVRWSDKSDSSGGPYESGLLKLNCDKAMHYLNWHAVLNFKDTVQMTADWYKTFYQEPSLIRDITNAQIASYSESARSQGLGWAQ